MSEIIRVAVFRRVKAGCEPAFEKALHDFVQRSMALPGQMGVQIVRPAPGSDSREYGIIRIFANREALTTFRTSPEYLEWNELAQEMTEGSGRAKELSGLENWFTLPGEPLRPLPKWKMALVTFLAVEIVTSVMAVTVNDPIKNWPYLFRSVVSNALIVSCLTWVVMPVLTRIFHRWLHHREEFRSMSEGVAAVSSSKSDNREENH